MHYKPMLLVAMLALLVSTGFGCSESKSGCKDDLDCEVNEYCATDGKCYEIVNPDGGDGEDGGTQDGDAGPADADEEPPPCTHDRDCPPDKICDLDTGECVEGEACQHDYNCPDSSTHYCHPEGGVCKQRSMICEPCLEDYECEDEEMGDLCIDYPDGRYCARGCAPRACPAGYECDFESGSGGAQDGVCRCIGNVCGQCFVCSGDSDCPANKVCNLSSGTCVPMCFDDFSCAGGLKCHFTGHCGPPCSLDSECATYGPDLVCCISPGVPVSFCGQDSTGRCRPEGCALHSECLSSTEGTLGYCDKPSGECVDGCRWGEDLLNESDCKAGKKCDCVAGMQTCDSFDCCMDPGGPCLCDPSIETCTQVAVCDHGECIDIPCNERGDVAFCARSQLCCGWPGDGYDCEAGVSEGECYMADANTWCAPCGDVGPCDTPNMGYGEPGVCLPDTDENNYCHPACRDNQDCPSTWECDHTFYQPCETAADCEGGASCDVIDIAEDGTVSMGCHCADSSHCPADLQGFTFTCETMTICDSSGSEPVCHEGHVCMGGKVCQCSNCCGQLHGG